MYSQDKGMVSTFRSHLSLLKERFCRVFGFVTASAQGVCPGEPQQPCRSREARQNDHWPNVEIPSLNVK